MTLGIEMIETDACPEIKLQVITVRMSGDCGRQEGKEGQVGDPSAVVRKGLAEEGVLEPPAGSRAEWEVRTRGPRSRGRSEKRTRGHRGLAHPAKTVGAGEATELWSHVNRPSDSYKRGGRKITM